MANTYQLIASNTLASSAASVTFSSIPDTYTDLVIRGSSRDSYATAANQQEVRITFNGSSTAVYSHTYLNGSGSAASSSRGSNQAYTITMGFGPSAINTANTFSNLEIYIPNYTSSNNKPLGSFSAGENNATAAYIETFAGLWRNTSAISSITLTSATANFVSGSSFFLYGIKSS